MDHPKRVLQVIQALGGIATFDVLKRELGAHMPVGKRLTPQDIRAAVSNLENAGELEVLIGRGPRKGEVFYIAAALLAT